jgi:hypothetical protein
MKRILFIFIAAFLISIGYVKAQDYTNAAVYLEIISNPDKTIDFTLGIYPETYEYNYEGKYSTMVLRVLNNSKESLNWKDYKIYILLKDNTLFYNYKTKASSGLYGCNYSIETGGSNDQRVCFSKKFDVEDIEKVWLSFDDAQFFNLLYNPRKDK